MPLGLATILGDDDADGALTLGGTSTARLTGSGSVSSGGGAFGVHAATVSDVTIGGGGGVGPPGGGGGGQSQQGGGEGGKHLITQKL